MQRFIFPLIVVACGLSSGCGLLEWGRDTARVFTPRGTDYDKDDIYDSRAVDDWSSVGREGRGDSPIDKESDGLTPYLSSDKARRIARNVNVDSP